MIITQYEDVILRDFDETDIPKKVEWINNPENNQYLHYDLPLEIDKTISWFRNKDNSARLDCVIEYNRIPVGIIGLLQIDRINRKAEYYITIGEPDFKNKGIATKATRAIIKYAFEDLNLHKVYLTVDANNKKAISLYEKVGFRQEGYFVGELFCPKIRDFIDRKRYSVIDNSSILVGGGVTLYFEITNQKSTNGIFQGFTHLIANPQHNEIYIKRDDLYPFSFGGNKARKANLFFKEIDQGGFDYVVTYGSSSSNHCRVVSNMAASRGLPCLIISPEEESKETFNTKCMRLFGATIKTCPVAQVSDTIDAQMESLKKQGFHPYFIQGGGHGNSGTQAYVDCFDEIVAFEEEQGFSFDYIFLASGTGTTQAGLICGKILHQSNVQIVGISIARPNPRGRDVVCDSVSDYMESIGRGGAYEELVLFTDQYRCGGYGKYNDAICQTIKHMMCQEGIPLSTTYTGKAFWGMEEYIKENHLSGKKILFLHTGGVPLFFDDLVDKL